MPTNAQLDPILIVDDEKDNLEALRRLLRNQFTVTVADSPFEALRLVQQSPFHVIVSDQRMPEMTGVEFFEKAKHVRPESVRILLTGYTDVESVIGAINRGAIYRYVAKPWDPEELKLTLRQANEAYLLRRELDDKNRALEKSLQALQVLDRAKARFLSLVSHELNTPLTVLSAFVSLLSEKRAGFPPEVQKAVASLEAASGRFSEIVSEVIHFVRLEAEGEWKLVDFDLLAELLAVKSAVAPLAEKRKVTVVVKPTASAIVRCEPEKMRLALRRAVEDAILRSPEGESVRLVLAIDDTRAAITIERKGEPLAAEALEPLETAADPMHHHKNLGLALAMCRVIVQRHGGEVTLDSSAAPATRLRVALPLPL